MPTCLVEPQNAAQNNSNTLSGYNGNHGTAWNDLHVYGKLKFILYQMAADFGFSELDQTDGKNSATNHKKRTHRKIREPGASRDPSGGGHRTHRIHPFP